jgi:hypothetical protein
MNEGAFVVLTAVFALAALIGLVRTARRLH